jgi:hypothetical protein
MMLTNNALKRIKLERRNWRELVETRLPATTHHMLTQNGDVMASTVGRAQTRVIQDKCEKEQRRVKKRRGRKKPWKKPERL